MGIWALVYETKEWNPWTHRYSNRQSFISESRSTKLSAETIRGRKVPQNSVNHNSLLLTCLFLLGLGVLMASLVVQKVKNLPIKQHPCSIPGSGRSPGGRHGNPVQYSCLENPMDRGAWWATVHGVIEWLTLSLHFHQEEDKACNTKEISL